MRMIRHQLAWTISASNYMTLCKSFIIIIIVSGGRWCWMFMLNTWQRWVGPISGLVDESVDGRQRFRHLVLSAFRGRSIFRHHHPRWALYLHGASNIQAPNTFPSQSSPSTQALRRCRRRPLCGFQPATAQFAVPVPQPIGLASPRRRGHDRPVGTSDRSRASMSGRLPEATALWDEVHRRMTSTRSRHAVRCRSRHNMEALIILARRSHSVTRLRRRLRVSVPRLHGVTVSSFCLL